jgi:hypothetical protein
MIGHSYGPMHWVVIGWWSRIRNDKNVHHLNTNSYVGFGSSTKRNINPHNFCYRTQRRHALVRWDPSSNLNKDFLIV